MASRRVAGLPGGASRMGLSGVGPVSRIGEDREGTAKGGQSERWRDETKGSVTEDGFGWIQLGQACRTDSEGWGMDGSGMSDGRGQE